MPYQITFGANVNPTTSLMEVSIDGGVSFVNVTFATIGTNQQGTLSGVPVGTYAAGLLIVGAKGFPATRLANSATVTVISNILPLNFINIGDSITAGPAAGTGSQPTASPGQQATNRITAPAITFTKFGFPGQSIRQFLDNASYKASVVSSLRTGQRNIISFAFGTNDLNNFTAAQIRANFAEALTWATGLTGVEGVLFIPLANRGGGYGYALADDGVTQINFNAPRLAHNAWLLNTFKPTNAKIQIGPTSGAVALFADAAYNDTTLFAPDLTHPTILGSQIMGERVVAEGLALFGGLTLRAASVVQAAGTAEGVNYLPGFTAVTLVTSANVVNTGGVYTAPSGGYYTETAQGGKLAAGTNGMFVYKVYGGRDVVIGWDDRPDIDGYNTVEASLYQGTGGTTFNTFDSSVQNVLAGVGQGNGWLGIRRTGSLLTLELTQQTDGTGWNVLRSFNYSSAADLFLKAYINSTGQMSYPQTLNLAAVATVAPANTNYLPGFTQFALGPVANLINTNATYTAPTGGVYNTVGSGSIKIAAGVDAIIAFKLVAGSQNVVFGLQPTNAAGTYTNAPVSLLHSAGTTFSANDTVTGTTSLFTVQTGAPTTGFLGLHRVGGVFTIRYNDGVGGGWGAPLRTMTYQNTGDMFAFVYANADGKIAYLQAKGMVAQ